MRVSDDAAVLVENWISRVTRLAHDLDRLNDRHVRAQRYHVTAQRHDVSCRATSQVEDPHEHIAKLRIDSRGSSSQQHPELLGRMQSLFAFDWPEAKESDQSIRAPVQKPDER